MMFYSNDRIYLCLPIAYMKQSCAPNSQIAFIEKQNVIKSVALYTLRKDSQISRRCTDSTFTFKERRQHLRKFYSINCNCTACGINSKIEARWYALKCNQCQGCCPTTTQICFKCDQPHLAFENASDRTKQIAHIMKNDLASLNRKKILDLMSEMRTLAWKENIYLLITVMEFFKICFDKNIVREDVKAKKNREEENFASLALSILVNDKGDPIWSLSNDIIRNSLLLQHLSDLAVLAGNFDLREKFKLRSTALSNSFVSKPNLTISYYDLSDDSEAAAMGELL